MKDSTFKVLRSIGRATYEYLLIVVPVGVYVGIEAIHKNYFAYFFISPEWAIANIFLSSQTVALYWKYLSRNNKSIRFGMLGAMLLVAVILIVVSTINALMSLESNNQSLITVRIVMFWAVTILFLLFVGGAAYSSSSKGGKD